MRMAGSAMMGRMERPETTAVPNYPAPCRGSGAMARPARRRSWRRTRDADHNPNSAAAGNAIIYRDLSMTEPESSLHAAVPVELAGRRFDQALAELFPDYSRSRLTRNRPDCDDYSSAPSKGSFLCVWPLTPGPDGANWPCSGSEISTAESSPSSVVCLVAYSDPPSPAGPVG